MKTLTQLRNILIRHFNEFIRLRDKHKGCISCIKGPVQHAGHYWSTSQCPQASMRFFEKNVHGQCNHCNTFLEGNRQGYREGLIKRFGQKILEELDVKRSLKQKPWTRFEYEMMIKHYKQKAEELKNVAD